MQLDQVSQAAKRLRKQQDAFVQALAAPLSHGQALNIVAQLHGFRHYHELQQYSKNISEGQPTPKATSVYQKARELLQTTGGLFPVEGMVDDLLELPWEAGEVLVLEGSSGTGKTSLAAELACRVLAQGQQVRIWDSYKEYDLLTRKLGGQYFSDPASPEFLEAWCSNSPLVVLNVSHLDSFDAAPFDSLSSMLKQGVLVCEELRQPMSLSNLGVRTIRTVYVPRLHTSSKTEYKYKLKHEEGSRDKWKLQGLEGSAPVVFRHRITKARANALFKAG